MRAETRGNARTGALPRERPAACPPGRAASPRVPARRPPAAPRAGRPVPDGDRGFTLLEVLVAFVIAALAMSALASAAVSGMRNAAEAGRYEDALARARAHLAGIPWPPNPGDFEGDDGQGYHWHLRIVRDQHAVTSKNVDLSLYDVLVAISWTDGDDKRVVQLDTRRALAGTPRA